MKDKPATKEHSIFVPFLVGGIVGSTIGLLLAPKPGKEMRKQIRDLAEDGKHKVASAIGKSREFYTEAVAAANSAIDAGKQTYIQEREKTAIVH
ncbi:MAG: YtxH domain-containing protein [Nitrospiraceae bacterium]|nr:YtxH domain-containing protein [Nitrospiraceae bacterium]